MHLYIIKIIPNPRLSTNIFIFDQLTYSLLSYIDNHFISVDTRILVCMRIYIYRMSLKKHVFRLFSLLNIVKN